MDKWPEPRPIDEAPKGDSDMLFKHIKVLTWMWGGWRIAYWDWDAYAKKPKPFWNCHEIGISSSRAHQPEWWLPLPPPVKGEP